MSRPAAGCFRLRNGPSRVLTEARARLLDLGPPLTKARDFLETRDVDRALADALDRDIARARALDLDIARADDLDFDLACEDARALADALDRDVALARALDLDLDVARIPISYVARARDLARNLVTFLERAGASAKAPGRRGRGPRRMTAAAAWLLAVAAGLLAAADRTRYAAEFKAELWELAQAGAGRRAQVGYAARQVRSAVQLRAALRAPARRGATP